MERPLRPFTPTKPSKGKPTKISDNKLWSTPSHSPSSPSPYLFGKDTNKDIKMEELKEIEKTPKLSLKQGKKRKGAPIIFLKKKREPEA
jgi:hypothetical protein